jgi:hypothetical protein
MRVSPKLFVGALPAIPAIPFLSTRFNFTDTSKKAHLSLLSLISSLNAAALADLLGMC